MNRQKNALKFEVRGLFLPLIGYIVAALAATWPLITHLRGWVPGIGDWGQNLWALWWTRHALLVLRQPPFFTNYLFYPEGITLLFHPLDVSDGLLALPLYGVLGGDATYNLLILLSFVLGGGGAYLLAFYLTGRRGASFAAGLVFALAPYHFLRIYLGHLNLSTLQWIPFYILFLFRYIHRGAKRDAGLAVFFLVFMALNSWYYVIYCGLLSAAALFWPTSEGLGQRRFGLGDLLTRGTRIGLVVVAAGLVLLLLLWPMFQLLSSTELVGEHNPLRHSVDLLSFFVPGPPSSWSEWFESIWAPYAAQNREPGASAYLGYTVLGVSLVSLGEKARRKQVIWWWLTGTGFMLLALGPKLQVGGQILEIRLPYGMLTSLAPAFAITGVPGRFVVMSSLALAMLTAYGLSVWQKRLPQHSIWLWLVVTGLIGLEYGAVPLHLSSTKVSPFYQQMGEQQEFYTVVDIKWDANFLMYAQTVHHKPLIGGWLARLPKEKAVYLNQGGVDKTFMALLLGPERWPDIPAEDVPAALRAALREKQVRYLIDHNHRAGGWLEKYVGWPVVYMDEELTVYGAPLPAE